MTREQRKARFDELFYLIPNDPDGQRVRDVCAMLGVTANTVRCWKMENPARVPNEHALELLQMRIRERGIAIH